MPCPLRSCVLIGSRSAPLADSTFHSWPQHRFTSRPCQESRGEKRKARKQGKVKNWKEELEKVKKEVQSLSFIPCTVWIQLLHELITPAEIKQTVTVRSDFLLGSSAFSVWLERETLRCLLIHMHFHLSISVRSSFFFLVLHHWTSNITSFHLMCNYYDYHFQTDQRGCEGPGFWPRDNQIQLHKCWKRAIKKWHNK